MKSQGRFFRFSRGNPSFLFFFVVILILPIGMNCVPLNNEPKNSLGSPPRIIAVLSGQDGIIGPRHLHLSLHDEEWMYDVENIVGLFEEDSDWNPFWNAERWIRDQKKIYPNAPVILVGHSNGADGVRKIADQLKNDNIEVTLLYVFDLVPKPWKWENPATESPLAVTNVDTTICLFQRDDPRRLSGFCYMQGWLLHSGLNLQWHTANPALQPSTLTMYYTVDGILQTIDAYPHTEMIFSEQAKAELRNAIYAQ